MSLKSRMDRLRRSIPPLPQISNEEMLARANALLAQAESIRQKPEFEWSERERDCLHRADQLKALFERVQQRAEAARAGTHDVNE